MLRLIVITLRFRGETSQANDAYLPDGDRERPVADRRDHGRHPRPYRAGKDLLKERGPRVERRDAAEVHPGSEAAHDQVSTVLPYRTFQVCRVHGFCLNPVTRFASVFGHECHFKYTAMTFQKSCFLLFF